MLETSGVGGKGWSGLRGGCGPTCGTTGPGQRWATRDPRDGEGRGGSCCTRGAEPVRQTRQLLPLRILSLLRHPQAVPPPTHLLQLSLEDNESIKQETLLGIFPTSGPGGKQSTGYKKAGSTLGILMHSKTNCSKTSLFLSPNERYTRSVFLRNNQVQSRNEEALLSSAGEATGCPSRGARPPGLSR